MKFGKGTGGGDPLGLSEKWLKHKICYKGAKTLAERTQKWNSKYDPDTKLPVWQGLAVLREQQIQKGKAKEWGLGIMAPTEPPLAGPTLEPGLVIVSDLSYFSLLFLSCSTSNARTPAEWW